MKEIFVYTDGGSLNNPGKSAIGVIIKFEDKIKEYAKEIGIKTNNEAEYEAVIFALEKIKKFLGKEKIKNYKIILHLDSELVGKQLRGEYKILEENLQRYFIQFWNLKIDFGEIEIKIIPREENQRADKLVKSVLFQKNGLF
ncbi:14.7 kDa ribonuclease H-like protein [bacterium HR35]|nr:14.7 kDa ribonuclease H-like protein [bacterium HR35]